MMVSPSNRNRTLFLLIAMLLLINIGLIIYFVMQRRGDEDRGRRYRVVPEWLSEEVGFDSSQMKRYHALRDSNRAVMKAKSQRMMQAKDNLFRLLTDSTVTNRLIDSMAGIVAQRQKELDLHLYGHFSQIRGICRPEQVPRYNQRVNEIIRELIGPPRRGRERETR